MDGSEDYARASRGFWLSGLRINYNSTEPGWIEHLEFTPKSRIHHNKTKFAECSIKRRGDETSSQYNWTSKVSILVITIHTKKSRYWWFWGFVYWKLSRRLIEKSPWTCLFQLQSRPRSIQGNAHQSRTQAQTKNRAKIADRIDLGWAPSSNT